MHSITKNSTILHCNCQGFTALVVRWLKSVLRTASSLLKGSQESPITLKLRWSWSCSFPRSFSVYTLTSYHRTPAQISLYFNALSIPQIWASILQSTYSREVVSLFIYVLKQLRNATSWGVNWNVVTSFGCFAFFRLLSFSEVYPVSSCPSFQNRGKYRWTRGTLRPLLGFAGLLTGCCLPSC